MKRSPTFLLVLITLMQPAWIPTAEALHTEVIAEGFDKPVFVTAASSNSQRLFVPELKIVGEEEPGMQCNASFIGPSTPTRRKGDILILIAAAILLLAIGRRHTKRQLHTN